MRYEEAKKIALKQNAFVNACYEYDKGWYFYIKGAERDGGGDDFVVLKENGKVVFMPTFLGAGAPNPKRKRMDF